MILHRRDRREVVMTANSEWFADLGLSHKPEGWATRYARVLLPVAPLHPGGSKNAVVCSCLFDEFLAVISPSDIRQLVRDA